MRAARAAEPVVPVVKSLAAVRTPSAPAIDGRLDDAVWALVQPDDRFTQRFPRDGAPPAYRTTVRVLYDDSAVYVGMRMDDPEPDKIVARLTRRDHLVESDYVVVGFDSRHDHSTGYFFVLNAAGVQLDGTFFDDTSTTYDWDAVWDGTVSRDSGGWSAEFKIPLSVLRFPDLPVQEWGIQAERYLARTKEDDRWSYTPQNIQAVVSPMGHLTGLTGLRPRRTWELRPFTVGRMQFHADSGTSIFGLGNPDGRDISPEATIGVDGKVGLTSNLTLDATINPDFGQVEADEVVLNLSRFETFFPEKRPFFLEGSDLFRTDIGQFYSRRIGRGLEIPSGLIDDDGAPLTVTEAPPAVPIRAALKVAGKLGGGLSIGVLDAVTASRDVTAETKPDPEDGRVMSRKLRFVPYMNYAVLRSRYAFRGASYVGSMFTAATRLDGSWRNAADDHDGYSQGVQGLFQSEDSRWRISNELVMSERVGGPQYLNINTLRGCDMLSQVTGCIPMSRPDGTLQAPGDVGWGLLGAVNRTGVHWDLSVSYRALSPRLDLNDLGFLSEFNVAGAAAEAIYQQRDAQGPVQNYKVGLGYEELRTFDNVRTSRNMGLFGELRFTNFWSLNATLGLGLPGRWYVAETGDGASLERPPGASASVYVQTDTRAPTQLYTGFYFFHPLGEPGWTSTATAQVTFNVFPELQLDVSSDLAYTKQATRLWFGGGCIDNDPEAEAAPCTPLSIYRDYIFGHLDSGSLSFTSRASYTFSPRLSLQGYAQLFTARGEFTDYERLTTVGRHPKIRLDDLARDPAFSADLDGDGLKDDDFQLVSLNLNLVLRWEFLSGSALLVVYSRAQDASSDLRGRSPAFTPRGLANGPTEDVLLLKLSYFMR